MTAKRFERISNPVVPSVLAFGDTAGTKKFERIAHPVSSTPLQFDPQLELELINGTTTNPSRDAKE